MNLDTVTAWLRQPTMLQSLAIIIAGAVYWVTGDACRRLKQPAGMWRRRWISGDGAGCVMAG